MALKSKFQFFLSVFCFFISSVGQYFEDSPLFKNVILGLLIYLASLLCVILLVVLVLRLGLFRHLLILLSVSFGVHLVH